MLLSYLSYLSSSLSVCIANSLYCCFSSEDKVRTTEDKVRTMRTMRTRTNEICMRVFVAEGVF